MFEEEGTRNYVEITKRSKKDTIAYPGPRVLETHRKTLLLVVRAVEEVVLSDKGQILLKERRKKSPHPWRKCCD